MWASLNPRGTTLWGTPVKPENTFFSMKRIIGRRMSEMDEESKQSMSATTSPVHQRGREMVRAMSRKEPNKKIDGRVSVMQFASTGLATSFKQQQPQRC
ncbi:hypothetical protein ACFX2B_010058 [Malus domestica]